MQYNHELIVPNEDLPFKMFILKEKKEITSGKRTGIVLWRFLRSVMGNFVLYQREAVSSCAGRIYDREFQRSSFRAFSKAEPDDCIADTNPVVWELFTGEGFIWFTHNPVDRDERLMELIRQMYEVYIKKSVAMKWKWKVCFILWCICWYLSISGLMWLRRSFGTIKSEPSFYDYVLY